MSKKLVRRKTTPKKKRDEACLQRKINKITKWYKHILANHEAFNPNGTPKKVLRPLSYYIDKIKGILK